MSRLPLRIRLTLGFAAVVAMLLALVGTAVYAQMKRGIDQVVDRELSTRLSTALDIVADDGDDLGDPGRDPLAALGPGGFVQVLGPGRDVAGTTQAALGARPLNEVGTNPESAPGSESAAGARDLDLPGWTGASESLLASL